jgi:hypothetical protein
MKPSDVVDVLNKIGATRLHHANTVTTSCTFLEHGALLSRGHVEDHGLAQTPQYSDGDDKKYGIWHDIFVDTVDIHYRAGRVKGPNQYGPVLFELDPAVLLDLPDGSEVLVTKRNPVHWTNGQADDARWYLTADELSENMRIGNFDQMIVIKTASGTLDLPAKIQISLDDPQRTMSSGANAYTHAEERLKKAAAVGRVEAAIGKHFCRADCACIEKYKGYEANYFDSRFA